MRCYRQVVGRDTTTLQLTFNGQNATGNLTVSLYQKDRASGSILGTLVGNQLRADWQRSGEGITQLYEVVFERRGNALTWREGERVERAGKWVLAKPNQAYEYVLTEVDCP